MNQPKPAPAHWPYRHRTMAEVMATEERDRLARQARIAAQFGKEAG